MNASNVLYSIFSRDTVIAFMDLAYRLFAMHSCEYIYCIFKDRTNVSLFFCSQQLYLSYKFTSLKPT